MIIYVWPNGNWIYDWEVHGFTLQHSATLEGGRWIDLDHVTGHYTKEENQAMLEALGE